MASGQVEAAFGRSGRASGGAAATVPRLSRRRRFETGLFVLPAVLFQLSWGWYPLVAAFVLSFTNARLRGPVEFTGLESYLRMWHDPLTAQAFQVTAIYAGLSIVLTFVVPIIVAILLMEMPRHVLRWMMLLWFIPLSFDRQHPRLPLHVQHAVRHLSVGGDRDPRTCRRSRSSTAPPRSISGSSFPGCSSSARV